jgi:signal transduction histidine kinase
MTLGIDNTADLRWIRALYEFGQQAANGAEPQRVQHNILEHIVSGFEAESGSIALLVDGSDDQLEIVAGTDLPPDAIGRRLTRGVGVFGHVVATGQAVLINGDAAEYGLPKPMGETRDRTTRSAMCWPLFVGERLIGALAVNRGRDSPKYTPRELDSGQAVTSLLALVMANHRMHVEREMRILELSTLNATMQRMNEMLEDAQNQVIQADKLASIGQIAAGVAHEINNPVAFVLSNLGTMQSYMEQLLKLVDTLIESDPAARLPLLAAVPPKRAMLEASELEFIRTDSELLVRESRDGLLRVKRIVQDLNNFSRSGAEETWESVDLHATIESTLNIVRAELKHKARIETRFGNLPEVECRPSRLGQVFLNLLVNAGQSIEEDGVITVSTGVELDEVWVRFEDTGCGIPQEHISRLFEPFFTTKQVGQGTGLGLSVSYAIVRKHGGKIDVDSEVGRGTRFTVRLPIRQPELHSPPGLAGRRSPGSAGNAGNAANPGNAGHAGHTGGKEALAAWQQTPPEPWSATTIEITAP